MSVSKTKSIKKVKAEAVSKLDIELNKVRHYAGMSRETEAFTAEIWLDGKKWATAEDDGGGGNILIQTVAKGYDELRRVDALCRSTYPRLKSKYFEDGLEMSLELLIGQLLGRHLSDKKFRRKLSSRVVAIEGAEIFEWSSKFKPTPENCAAIAKKHPNAKVLNVLPVEEALQMLWDASGNSDE